MQTKPALLLAFLSVVIADLAGDASSVVSQAHTMASMMESWKSEDGLPVSVQLLYGTLSSKVVDLGNEVKTADANGETVEVTNNVAASISGLLDQFTQKAEDFKAVGATSLIQKDLTDLAHPIQTVFSNLASVFGKNCDLYNSITASVNALNSIMNDVNKVYSISLSYDALPSCAGGEGAAGAAGAGGHNGTVGAAGNATAVNSTAAATNGTVATNGTAATNGTVATNGTAATNGTVGAVHSTHNRTAAGAAARTSSTRNHSSSTTRSSSSRTSTRSSATPSSTAEPSATKTATESANAGVMAAAAVNAAVLGAFALFV